MPILAALALVVHVTNLSSASAEVIAAAEHAAGEMFRAQGVDIEWAAATDGGAHVDAGLILVSAPRGAFTDSFIRVLGAASRTPSGGGTAWVFYDRVSGDADRYGVPLPQLLASVIAHEVGHLLQDTASHDDRGVMRANWGAREYLDAARGRLNFAVPLVR